MEVKKNVYRTGIDVGSTTLKLVIIEPESQKIIHQAYRRHKANIGEILSEELLAVEALFPGKTYMCTITGSAGMGISERLKIPFVQEVVSAVSVIGKSYRTTNVLIDLGGEDAKMVFFNNGQLPDIRMNGSCAGGTGAFIDQMADLLNVSPAELGVLAMKYEKIYPVASRCGVFAKTDIQNLISRHVPKADIAMSIFHAVALQTISSLAKGMDIKPVVLGIGGPLTFLPALRQAFEDLLGTEVALPQHSEYFSAYGAALQNEYVKTTIPNLLDMLKDNPKKSTDTLGHLFKSKSEYVKWKSERNIKEIETYTPAPGETLNCFLAIDSGSTTTKILVMNEDAKIVYTFYDKNNGNSLATAVGGLRCFYQEMREKNISINVLASTATGYGEDLLRSALNMDYGIVETTAHLSGAQYVNPDATFVLDIGGQDIKAIFIENGAIVNIEINEACSSGCGSFLQNFASTMNLSIEDFVDRACTADAPADLGSRCTVFMNSKVKQSLRDNAGIDNIAAGLAYSVVKNCLFKVLKMSNLKQLGDNIIVQGGTFRNDAVFRAIEILSGKQISSTDRPEIMGAFGAALYARKKWKENGKKTGFGGFDSLPDCDRIITKELSCKGCTNKCSVLRFTFENGNICYAGNKCEKVFYSKNTAPNKGFNAFELKNDLLFNRKKEGEKEKNNLPVIGIPRVLNMFENYPFWYELLVECGFRIVISPESTIDIYRKGAKFVMSDNICFPAKLVQGHIISLSEEGVDRIFYPIIIKEEKEFDNSVNSYNCPIVSGYPDVVRSSIDTEDRLRLPFDKPVINFVSDKALMDGCWDYVKQFGIGRERFRKAFDKALKAREMFLQQLVGEQKARFMAAQEKGELCFVVAGRPYHADPLVHQKTGQTLSDMGVNVFTDDVFRHSESDGFTGLRLVSQWAYPNRVVQAAMEVAKLPKNVQLVQLNSFGCGPDSFFIDETADVLRKAGKNHTVIRIDEIASGGSIRLRLRSLVESLQSSRKEKSEEGQQGYQGKYTENDREKTILVPWFADHLSPFIPVMASFAGYKMENLPKSSKSSSDKGLYYGNNEVCYPSILILGDIIDALQSGKYNPEDVVVAVTQTGGQCRATNYLSQIKAGLSRAGFGNIPVLAISSGKVFQNDQSSFRIPYIKFLNIMLYSIACADALQNMYSRISARERVKGQAKALFDTYISRCVEAAAAKDHHTLLKILKEAVEDFNRVPVITEKQFISVGLVGEIYVKYNDHGQANISQWLRSQNIEVITPPVVDFLMQFFVNSKVNSDNRISRTNMITIFLSPLFRMYIDKRMNDVDRLMQSFHYYEKNENIFVKARYASEILDLSNQFGEGWMIAAEVASFVRRGINRIICIQPFGCIANHVVAKGVEKRIKKLYPGVNLLFLDIDSGIAEVNIHNRLRFLIENNGG
jgi:predicted CoA-substrate-specific enzyme activase